MDASLVSSLVNLGSAGAVIIVVIIFLKTIKERDAEWRGFFTELNRANCEDGEKRLELTEKILEMVQLVLHAVQEHDAKTDARIKDAAAANIEAVNKAVNGKTQPRRPA